jgi:hypothetical protein
MEEWTPGSFLYSPFGEYKLQANSHCCDGYIFPHTAKSVCGFALQVKGICEGKKYRKKFISIFGDFQGIVSHNVLIFFFFF